MEIGYDPQKREWTLRHRALDFADAEEVLNGPRFTYEDTRRDYGEKRSITLGLLARRLIVVVWTSRDRDEDEEVAHIISMRKANDREKARFQNELRET